MLTKGESSPLSPKLCASSTVKAGQERGGERGERGGHGKRRRRKIGQKCFQEERKRLCVGDKKKRDFNEQNKAVFCSVSSPSLLPSFLPSRF